MSTTLELLLTQLSVKHNTSQQKLKRIKILLKGREGQSNSQISRDLSISYKTVLKWRKRWLSEYESLQGIEEAIQKGEEKKNALSKALVKFLQDQARSGAPKTFSLAQRQQIVALCCESPKDYGLEMTDWTHEMLAKTAISKGIVPSISASHLGKILKKSALTTT
ncbi:MAG: helix-turn-helix domain-containing protein [Bacteroidota bacterium]